VRWVAPRRIFTEPLGRGLALAPLGQNPAGPLVEMLGQSHSVWNRASIHLAMLPELDSRPNSVRPTARSVKDTGALVRQSNSPAEG